MKRIVGARGTIVGGLSLAFGQIVCSALAIACGATVNVGEGQPPGPSASEPSDPSPAGPSGSPGEAPTLDWDGSWEWLTPQTTMQTIYAGYAVAEDDIWLVGDSGTVLRWDGKGRAKIAYQGPFEARYRAISATSPNDIWIAGDHTALHFNGISWTSSLTLGDYDVRELVRGDDGSIVARTVDEVVLVVSPARYSPHARGALDVVPAPGKGFHVLTREGVSLLTIDYGAKPIVTFPPNKLRSTALEGRLLGREAASFRYLFGYKTLSNSGASFEVNYQLYANDFSSVSWWEWANFMVTDSEGLSSTYFGRVDADRLFVHVPRRDNLWLLDGKDVRSTPSNSLVRERGAMLLPGNQPAILGKSGLVAEVSPSSTPKGLDIRDRSGEGASPEFFAVAPDSSAWGIHSSPGSDGRIHHDMLGRWEDDLGWQWHSLPTPSSGYRRWVVALAPLSESSVWLVLRTTDEGNPQYAGGDTLAHWNGSVFDVLKRAPKSLRELKSDRGEGFFALATDGELYHADASGKLEALADVGTSGEDGFMLCTPRLAPLSPTQVWTLDNVCRLSFWNGTSLESRPSFRSQVHGSGWISFDMWAASPTSLWLTDPHQGLQHYDGKSWQIVWRSQKVPYGIWGVDDNHVWFVDGPYSSPDPRAVLRMWDGTTARPIAPTPQTAMFGGGRDTVWLAGDRSLLRLRATTRGSKVR